MWSRMRTLALVVACAAMGASCSTKEAHVTVVNQSGGRVDVQYTRSTPFPLQDGESKTFTESFDRFFSFLGADETSAHILAVGTCIMPFDSVVTVRAGDDVSVVIEGDAGFLDICNQSGQPLTVYLSSCADSSRGTPDDEIPDGYCATWKLEVGCWDLRLEGSLGAATNYAFNVLSCKTRQYTITSIARTASAAPWTTRPTHGFETAAGHPTRRELIGRRPAHVESPLPSGGISELE